MRTRIFQIFACCILILIGAAACSPTAAVVPTSPAATAPAASAPVVPIPTVAILSDSTGCANAYFPTVLGAAWTYSSSGGAKGSYSFARTMPTVNDNDFTTTDVFSSGTNWTARWTCQGGNLAAMDAGPDTASLTTAKYTWTGTTASATGYIIPAAFSQGSKWTLAVTLNGTFADSAGATTDSQIVANFDCAMSGAEQISVPAGKFITVKATCTKKVTVTSTLQGKSTQLGANQETITYWYAKDIGLIKSVATGGSNNETVVLTGFKIPN